MELSEIEILHEKTIELLDLIELHLELRACIADARRVEAKVEKVLRDARMMVAA